jgi:hypothetical protein
MSRGLADQQTMAKTRMRVPGPATLARIAAIVDCARGSSLTIVCWRRSRAALAAAPRARHRAQNHRIDVPRQQRQKRRQKLHQTLLFNIPSNGAANTIGSALAHWRAFVRLRAAKNVREATGAPMYRCASVMEPVAWNQWHGKRHVSDEALANGPTTSNHLLGDLSNLQCASRAMGPVRSQPGSAAPGGATLGSAATYP